MAKLERKIFPSPDNNQNNKSKSKNNGRIIKNKVAKKKQQKFRTENNESINNDNGNDAIVLEPVRQSDDIPLSLNTKWINKQRVLVLASRGITYRDRHLMNNLKTLMPHSKSEPKMETKDPNLVLNEICEIRNCNKCIFFENRKRKDLYMWFANIPNGPTAKFLVENIHTMEELRMTGNCLKSSRPFLSFDPKFESEPYLTLLRELFTQIFGTPKSHPKSQPFFDHVFTFTLLDHRIWFRNYQILDEKGSLAEIGPRFCLNLIKIFDGSFMGRVLYSNPHYISPNKHRILIKQAAADKYRQRLESKQQRQLIKPANHETYADLDQYDDVFETIRPEDAIGPEKAIFQRKK
ncbi:Ribosome biogenesis protein BRX1 [Dermatophagoides pteronyssinus]|uniref:Ribosome biogenesis protein BRX1 homolog n=1 Tax=Dermatophagoides pteronyssinus TaxID=6956 RepID=A0ABQ8JL88_DERPT|nr:Ribosome biogenesis protein BRX1 [Dermatophagoides pteronyssinus]